MRGEFGRPDLHPCMITHDQRIQQQDAVIAELRNKEEELNEQVRVKESLCKENKQTIVDSIFDEELKTKVVKAINDNVDVPFTSESTEEKIIEALYSSVEDVVKETIVSKL